MSQAMNKSGEMQVSSAVMCSVCGGDIDYAVLADAIMVVGCKKGCRGGVVVMRAAMEDAIKDMDANAMVANEVAIQ